MQSEVYKNYHTHTWRCRHAEGDIKDYCDSAIKKRVKVLGFADHTPFPDNRWLFRRMHYNQLNDYISAIDKEKNLDQNLVILKSMECDYIKEFKSFYGDELLGECKCDYLIGSVHWFHTSKGWIEVPDANATKNHLIFYTKQLLEAMCFEKFLFIAHPDLFGMFYPNWDAEAISCSRDILDAAESLKIPLELNTHGLRKTYYQVNSHEARPKYPINPFWELAAEYNIKIVINSDAHRPTDLTAGLSQCKKMASRLGLEMADFSFLE